MARAYTTYNPLRAFVGLGLAIAFVGVLPIVRFLIFVLQGAGDGHVQSLVIGGALLILGAMVAVMGLLADLSAANRKLIDAGLVRLHRIRAPLAAPNADATPPVRRGPPQT